MDSIKNIVNDLVTEFKTRNPFELCDCLNIPILYEPLGNIKGFFQNILNTPIIHLNSNLNEHEVNCVLSHELGHAVLHKDLNVCFLKHYTFSVTDKYENEANKFTTELLIEDSSLIDILEINNLITCEDLSKYFSVPTEFISYKFSSLNF
ncbi:ImmA/IrrE family metallo-endopeptidase [Paraclostridium bifermentans]|uniref:ImmA/IrrE family metallo-endopeptidase n=1 Tax=Paraclostridium TaxID=1849822 RepID=UPI001CC718B3|nr:MULTISPECIES: ImmA/IrrE family metallo-endopeptidase [Paraclostridium]MBZ6007286.1 ImmA/IrrE family metallo-endopeptidase [Paraclostridium bifermentans]MDU0296656.1 ImmA/IrrE family metallo-endopeptidase [Paraclostridium sp. MRS3W1]